MIILCFEIERSCGHDVNQYYNSSYNDFVCHCNWISLTIVLIGFVGEREFCPIDKVAATLLLANGDTDTELQ